MNRPKQKQTYTRSIPKKIENREKNTVLYERHPIFYRTRNFMGAPKENKGYEVTPQLNRTDLYPFKCSFISFFPNIPHDY